MGQRSSLSEGRGDAVERGRRVGEGEVVGGKDEVEEERRICRRRTTLDQRRKE